MKPGEWMNYTIYFENQTNATAAAQEVTVTLPLDAALDWDTFELGEVVFNNQIDTGLVGKQKGESVVTMNGTNFNVRTRATVKDGVAQWYLRIVDPATADGWPEDAYAGFLPPNDETHRGEGHLTYRVRVRDDAQAGEIIRAEAEIVFDYNDAIKTDPSWWNTVAPRGAVFETTEVEVDEGGTAEVKIFGGNADAESSVKVWVVYNTAAAADLDLAKGMAVSDGTTASSPWKKFPVEVKWAKGEIGVKTVEIPIKADKSVEADEFFTLQLAEGKNIGIGEACVCTVVIRDRNDDPKAGDPVSGGWVKQTLDAKKGEVTWAAKARPGWTFGGWSNADGVIVSTKTSFKAKAGETLTGVFARTPYLRGLAIPAEAGKVSGSGLLAQGKKATLKATANKGWVFVGWELSPARENLSPADLADDADLGDVGAKGGLSPAGIMQNQFLLSVKKGLVL